MPNEKFNDLEINMCYYLFNSRSEYMAFVFVFVFCTWENWWYIFFPLDQMNIIFIFGILKLR